MKFYALRYFVCLLLLVACASVPPATATSDGKSRRVRHVFVSGDGEFEQSPPQLGGDELDDEGVLREVGQDRFCVDFTLQTEQMYDRSLKQMSPKCLLDGRSVPVELTPQGVNVVELWYEVFNICCLCWLDQVLYVSLRKERLCCQGEAFNTVEIELRNDIMGVTERDLFYLRMRWELDAGHLRSLPALR